MQIKLQMNFTPKLFTFSHFTKSFKVKTQGGTQT